MTNAQNELVDLDNDIVDDIANPTLGGIFDAQEQPLELVVRYQTSVICATINLSTSSHRIHPGMRKHKIVSKLFRAPQRRLLEVKEKKVPMNHFLIQKLQNETEARTHAENLCASYEDTLWIATARSIMDQFEDIQGYNSVIDRRSVPTQLLNHGRYRVLRKMTLIWILKNRKEDHQVQSLIKNVKRSIELKQFTSIDDFADAYASLYNELSETLKTRLLHPRKGVLNLNRLLLNKSANKAMSVFMSIFDVSKSESHSEENLNPAESQQ